MSNFEPRSTRVTIAIVGAGPWVVTLLDVLAASTVRRELSIRLTALRHDRLATIAEHADRRVRSARPEWSVTAAPTFARAIRGADIVILLFRVGGAAARTHDESFPAVFGVAGDEGLGPGGMANAWRTLPVITDMAAAVCEHAHDTLVLNLVAPLGMTTRALLEAGCRAIGLCELPAMTRDQLVERIPGLDRSSLDYAGLNHLGWFWPTTDSAARLLQSAPTSVLDRELYNRFDAVPLGYVTKMMKPVGKPSSPPRGEVLATLADDAVRTFRATPGADVTALARRATPWFDQIVVPVVVASLEGGELTTFLNLRNGTSEDDELVPSIDAAVVVEVEARLGDAITPRRPSTPPPAVAEFLAKAGEAEDLSYRAAVQREPALVSEALRALPFPIGETAISGLASAVCDSAELRA